MSVIVLFRNMLRSTACFRNIIVLTLFRMMDDMKDIQHLNEEDARTWKDFISHLMGSPEPNIPTDIYQPRHHVSRRLDLHGFTVHRAWVEFRDFINEHHRSGTKEVLIITGRSGRISHEFTEWCRGLPSIRSYEPIDTRNGRAGSYRVRLRKS